MLRRLLILPHCHAFLFLAAFGTDPLLSQISAQEHALLKIATALLSRLHGAWTKPRLFSAAETYFVLDPPINVPKTNRSMATASLSKPAKLHGRAFYESMGSPKMIVAPMVDRSEFVSTRSFPSRTPYLTDATGVENAHQIVHG